MKRNAKKPTTIANYSTAATVGRGASLAAKLRSQVDKVTEAKWRAAVRLPIPAIGPDFVFEFVAQRIDFTSMLYAGLLPDAFARAILGSRERAQSEQDVADEFMNNASHEEKLGSLEWQLKIAQEVCFEPRLVMRDVQSDSEFDLRTMPFSGDLIIALFNYAMGLSPEIPVQTEGGQTTLHDVETFRSEQQGAELFNALPDGQKQRAAGV